MAEKENNKARTEDLSSLSLVMEKHLRNYFSAHKGDVKPTNLYNNVIGEVEKSLILETLASTRGNQIKASEILGINRNTLRSKILKIKAAQKKSKKRDN